MSDQSTAIMVVSFDKYSDIWDVFFLCLNRFWKGRECKTYLVTNNLCPVYDGVEVIKTGFEISWSHRVRAALEMIQEEYIILLLEDYLIAQEVDETKVTNALNYMQENNLDYLRIVPIPKIKKRTHGEFALKITDKMMYGVNLQAAIWKKSYLLKLLDDANFSAWEFEARQKFGAPTRITGDCQATNEYTIYYLNGIIQGKWYIKSIETLTSLGINITLGDRSVMTEKEIRREKIRGFFLHHLPPKIICMLKPIAKKLGFKFVT